MNDPQAALGVGGARPVVDAISIGIAIATIADWLPAVAALLTIVWTAIRIYETRTAQRLLRRRSAEIVGSSATDARGRPAADLDARPR